MNGICPTCRKPTIVGTDCAHCVSAAAGKMAALVAVPTKWNENESDSPRFFRRLLFGLVSVFGLFAGLGHLISAFTLIGEEGEHPNERTLIGALLASCLASGVIAGTANRKAELTGLALGVIAALGHLWQLNRTNEPLTLEWVLGFPLLAGVVGILAGFAGRLIYPPSPRLSLSPEASGRTIIRDRAQSNPMVIWRMMAGVAVSIAVTFWAGTIYSTAHRAFGSGVGSLGGNALVMWQITTLGAILGGATAGMFTRAGVKQGLLAGVLAGMGIAGLHLKFGTSRLMGLDFWLDQLSFNREDPALYGAVVLFTIAASLLGGWLGSQLFQPRRGR